MHYDKLKLWYVDVDYKMWLMTI